MTVRIYTVGALLFLTPREYDIYMAWLYGVPRPTFNGSK
jgi:hypothetical protein